MSIDGTNLLFEGFLQKRKDTVKIWVTYWFRLRNTTLFFYTKKNGTASHLRSIYYIYTMQSVREVQRADSKRFMFEIIMANGKRKLLAAETAALRQEWLQHLWQAMHLSTSKVSVSRGTHLDVCEQGERTNSSAPICSHSEPVTESLPDRPLSAPTSQIHHETRGISYPTYLSEELNNEETAHQNIMPAYHYQPHNGDSFKTPQWSNGLSKANEQEGDYSVLPIRKEICGMEALTEMDKDVYDVPLSYRRDAQHPDPTESIYDVPSSLLRTLSDHALALSSEEQLEDRLY